MFLILQRYNKEMKVGAAHPPYYPQNLMYSGRPFWPVNAGTCGGYYRHARPYAKKNLSDGR